MSPPSWLVDLERSLAEDEGTDKLAVGLVVLASIGGADVPLEPEEAKASTRRAVFLLASGGDPERGLDLEGRAVSAVAEELRTVDRQLALEEGLRNLRLLAEGLPHASEALHGMLHAPEVAWRAYAAALLAEELSSED
jgi:hypothetical protein